MRSNALLLTSCFVLCSTLAAGQETGSLRVTISPDSASQAGAAWRRVGTETWYVSGETETGIPKGTYLVEFIQLSGWYQSPAESALVRAGAVKRLAVDYSPKPIPGPEFEGCRLLNYGTEPYVPLPLINIMDIGGPALSWPDGDYEFCGTMDTIYCSLDAIAQQVDERVYDFAHLIQCLHADINGPLSPDPEEPYTPNGIPDAQYELAIIAAVLNDPDHALHEVTTDAFQYNYMLAKDSILEALSVYDGGNDLRSIIRLMAPHFPSALATVLAGYATMGDYDTDNALNELFTLLEGIGVTPIEGGFCSLTEKVPELGPEGDTNGDGITNRQAYNWYVGILNITPQEAVAGAVTPNVSPELIHLSGGGVYPPETNIMLETTVTHGAPQSYAWYKDDALIPGETGAMLSFALATAQDAAFYRVEVQLEPDFDPGALITVSAVTEVQIDGIAPVITRCPEAMQVSEDGSGQAEVPDFTGLLEAVDEYTAEADLVTLQVPAAGTFASVGDTVVTLMVSDAAGNMAQCMTVLQVMPPDSDCHPADQNHDWRVIMSEAILCLSGWQQGSTPMPTAIRAAYLWQKGEFYGYDGGQAPPLCWQLVR